MDKGRHITVTQAVHTEFRHTFETLLLQGELEAHQEFLVDHIADNKPALMSLFAYGIDRLPNDSSRPDNALASYFCVLSEIDGLRSELRDIAMDAMVYCETGSDEIAPTRFDIETEYQKIKPLF